MLRNHYNKKGFSLIEIVFALAVFGLIVGAVGAFARDVFFYNDVLQVSLTNVNDARKMLRPFANEVRSARPSELGSFAIAQTATSSFAFYSDIDNDGVQERVRYFLEGSDFKKGIIEPDGDPITYDTNNERVIRVVEHVVATTSIFSYYNSLYNGSTSTEPLADPVTSTDVRLVRADLTVDANPDRAPALLTVTTQVTIRNLKDNYETEE